MEFATLPEKPAVLPIVVQVPVFVQSIVGNHSTVEQLVTAASSIDLTTR
mgnify:CR=1 FL=1